MCSILGGTAFNKTALDLFNKARDRGRDYSGLSMYGTYWIANHRATPTNEEENPIENQPFGTGFKIVHNGTIANDKELGVAEGEIDSKALAIILERSRTVTEVAQGLSMVKGSFAVAMLRPDSIVLACNYKPIWWVEYQGEFYFSSLKHHLPGNPVRVPPYSVVDILLGRSAEIPRYQPDKALVICSGGLDSVAVTGYVKEQHESMRLLHFDYGCKATQKEIEAIKKVSKKLGCDYEVLDLDYSKFKGSSTLFKDEEISTGKSGVEYALDWVYARNLVMLSVATAYAEANGFGYIYLGTNLEESGAYPDNEEQFIIDFNNLLYGAVNNGYKVEIRTPLGHLMKREIVQFGHMHGSPIEDSWSCYNGGEVHCGQCGPCYMRQKAFARALITDPTAYKHKIDVHHN